MVANLGDKLPKENPCQHLELVEVDLITLLYVYFGGEI